MPIIKAYLDNDVVSAIAKDDNATESTALDRLLGARETGLVALVTSEITLGEIRKYSGPWLKSLERTFRLLEKVPIVRWDELVGMHSYGDHRTWINSPLIQNMPLYDSFLKLGVKPVDSQHLFVAAQQACTVFLTCDRGVLARSAGIQDLCALVVQRPSELATQNGW